MPLYEYECKKCHHRFERIQKFSDPYVKKCPDCGGPVELVVSAPAVQFKGSGWYVTDYAKKSSAPSNGDSGSKSDSGSGSKNESDSKSGSESRAESKPDPEPDSKSKKEEKSKRDSSSSGKKSEKKAPSREKS